MLFPLRLPPLRDRTEDVPDLIRHFTQQNIGEGLEAKRFDIDAMNMLKSHSWPGKVRELENFVRRVMALYPQDVISAEIIAAELQQIEPSEQDISLSTASGPLTISQAVEENMRSYFTSFGDGLPPSGLYQRIIEEVEYPLILSVLTATRGNQIKAAELLGLNRTTLRKKIRELRISIYRSAKPV